MSRGMVLFDYKQQFLIYEIAKIDVLNAFDVGYQCFYLTAILVAEYLIPLRW